MNKDDILVSINCITYNHEDYIADAMDSFLMQKTDFSFEIVVGEDCSQDRTRQILKKYKDKFPEKINLITSDQNLGMFKNGQRVHLASRGKYIAICEGDDYWIDPYKLQRQIEYMENNPKCSLCFHNAVVVSTDKKVIRRDMIKSRSVGIRAKYYAEEDRKYTAGELILLGMIPTNSMVYKKSTMDRVPDWYFTAPAGDICTRFLTAAEGYAYYINETMSAYRFGVPSSVSTQWRKELYSRKRSSLLKGYLQLIDAFDQYSNYKYNDLFFKERMLWMVELMLEEKKGRTILHADEYKEYRDALSFCGKVKLYIHAYLPRIYPFLAMNYRRTLDLLTILSDRMKK